MMENENNLLTRKEFLGELGKMERKITEKVIEKTGEKIDKSIDRAMGGLATMIQKGFAGITTDIEALDERITKLEYNVEKELKGIHNLFDEVFQELKDIRKQLAQVDTRAEVIDLDLRVSKIEKKLRFKA